MSKQKLKRRNQLKGVALNNSYLSILVLCLFHFLLFSLFVLVLVFRSTHLSLNMGYDLAGSWWVALRFCLVGPGPLVHSIVIVIICYYLLLFTPFWGEGGGGGFYFPCGFPFRFFIYYYLSFENICSCVWCLWGYVLMF